jgi:folate-binding protein YgfZ
MTSTNIQGRRGDSVPETRQSSVLGADTKQSHAEFLALRSGCGVYDLSGRARISLTGTDRVRWLNGMVTNNVRDLAAGNGVYAFLLNAQGRILGDLYAFNHGDSLVVESDCGQLEKILATFDHFIIMDDVEVNDLSGKLGALGVAGPKARQTLTSAGLDVPEMEPLEFRELTWQGVACNVTRDGDVEKKSEGPPGESYEIWFAPECRDGLWNALVALGATPIGSQALEMRRVALGVPRYGQDIRERDLPQETEQNRALNFSKGCYVGQEIVERIRSRGNVHRMFTGFVIEGALPEAGAKVTAGEKEVGEITSTASVPAFHGDLSVALGYIRREAVHAGSDVLIGGQKAIVAVTPFKEFLS